VELTHDVTDQVFPEEDRGETYPPGSELLLGIIRDAGTCNADELRALRVVMDKLISGRNGKPALNIASDKRDWAAEARGEITDAIWYWAFAVVKEGA
jgi:hypothetical protein